MGVKAKKILKIVPTSRRRGEMKYRSGFFIKQDLLEKHDFEYIHSNVSTFERTYKKLESSDTLLGKISEISAQFQELNTATVDKLKDFTKDFTSKTGITKETIGTFLKDQDSFLQEMESFDAFASEKVALKTAPDEVIAEKNMKEFLKLIDAINDSISHVLKGDPDYYNKFKTSVHAFEKLTLGTYKSDSVSFGKMWTQWKQGLGWTREVAVRDALKQGYAAMFPNIVDTSTIKAMGIEKKLEDVTHKVKSLKTKEIFEVGYNIKSSSDEYHSPNRTLDTEKFWMNDKTAITDMNIVEYAYWNWRALNTWHTGEDLSIGEKLNEKVGNLATSLENMYRVAMLYTVMIDNADYNPTSADAKGLNDAETSLGIKTKTGVANLFIILGSKVRYTYELYDSMNNYYGVGKGQKFQTPTNESKIKELTTKSLGMSPTTLRTHYNHKRKALREFGTRKLENSKGYGVIMDNDVVQQVTQNLVNSGFHFLSRKTTFNYQFAVKGGE